MGLYAFLSPFVSSTLVFYPLVLLTAQTPAIPQIKRDFNESNVTILSLLVSVYLLGFAVGPLIAAPTSELLGRYNY
jgi:MFS family permease